MTFILRSKSHPAQSKGQSIPGGGNSIGRDPEELRRGELAGTRAGERGEG